VETEKIVAYERIGKFVVEEVKKIDFTGDSCNNVAELVVDELNSITKINAMLEMGSRLAKIDPTIVGVFGFGCGGGCDAWGFGCGLGCLSGLPLTDELIKDRYAIDVLGKKGLAFEDMAVMHKDFGKFQKSVSTVLAERVNLELMDQRIAKYSK